MAEKQQRLPRWLRAPKELNEYGMTFWRAHARRLYEADRFKEDDTPLFVMLAQAYGMVLESQAKILKEGLFRQDENDVTRKHPATQVHRDAVAMYNKLAPQFGMSPLIRRREKIVDQTTDEFERFLARRKNNT
jgi:P27 family predicted phage terminase small subunit